MPVFLPGKPHGQRSLAGYSPKGNKELDMTEQLRTISLTTEAIPFELFLISQESGHFPFWLVLMVLQRLSDTVEGDRAHGCGVVLPLLMLWLVPWGSTLDSPAIV